MLMILPPIEPDEQANSYDYTVTLEDVTYRIVLTWRERCAAWYLALYDSADTLLLDGKRLSIDWPALERHTGRKPDDGMLLLWDTAESMIDGTFEELGDRCLFYWIPYSDLPAVEDTDYPITVAVVP
jgi:hypothetical protein